MTAELAVHAIKNAFLNFTNPEAIIFNSNLELQCTNGTLEKYV